MNGLDEDEMELEVHRSKEERRSKSCTNSPKHFHKPNKAKTIFQTEFRYHERSFHGKTTRYESNLCRRSISTPNFSQMKVDDCGLVTEVHLKTNDITLKVIQAPENIYC